jgi:hypothetical protein
MGREPQPKIGYPFGVLLVGVRQVEAEHMQLHPHAAASVVAP